MNSLSRQRHAIANWIDDTRQHSNRIDLEAESRLGRLAQLPFTNLEAATSSPVTLGLYGHSTEGKHHLLSSLVAEDGEWPCVQLGDKTLNYLVHINPGVAPLKAVRFTRTPPPRKENFPLLLNLHSETAVIIRLIERYHACEDARVMPSSELASRLEDLQAHRLAQPVPGLSVDQFASVTRAWKKRAKGGDEVDDGLLYQMAELIGWLSLHDRATLTAFLWGDDAAFTDEWLQLARALAHTGHAEQVLAPLSLIVDNYLLPAGGFLIPATPDEPARHDDVMVCPVQDGKPAAQISLSREHLDALCACVNLTLGPRTAPGEVDIVDIPIGELETFARQFQPDTLLLCNAANNSREVAQTARTLCSWLNQTQHKAGGSVPRLVWAITPFDQRFHQQEQHDDSVQQLITLAGHQWGILQAMDTRNVTTLRAWLAEALSPAFRAQRLNDLSASLRVQLNASLSGLLTPVIRSHEEAETLVRALQAHAAQIGELTCALTLSRNQLQQCWLQHEKKPGQTVMPGLTLDLFASPESAPAAEKEETSLADLIFKRWVNHVRQLSLEPEKISKGALPEAPLMALADVLIVLAHQLDLAARLQQALVPCEGNQSLAVTCAGNVLNDFVCWLGYQHLPPAQRPESRVVPGQHIFAPAGAVSADKRITQLGETPFPGHTRYAYDWLVGLYHRAIMTATADENDLPEAKRREYETLLTTAMCNDSER